MTYQVVGAFAEFSAGIKSYKTFYLNVKLGNTKFLIRLLYSAGSDGKEYSFLLKGHEDLRQDERIMQLFGLINTLLSRDSNSNRKNLRFVYASAS